MKSNVWGMIRTGMLPLLMISIVSCETISRTESPVMPVPSETAIIQQTHPYPPIEQASSEPPIPYPLPRPDSTDTRIPYPPPTSIPSVTSTPTVYRAIIQTLGPTEWATYATPMTPVPLVGTAFPTGTQANTPEAPLMPQHDLQLTFVDRLNGWVMGYTDVDNVSLVALASTADGGVTWQALRIPPIVQFYLPPFYWNNEKVFGLRFTSPANGWLYYDKLFATHDGGKSWVEEHPRGLILQMGRAIDGSYWALEQVKSDWILWQVSGNSYDQWINLGYRFPVTGDHPLLAVIDAQHAWISYWASFQTERPDMGTKLFATDDGGKNWEMIIPPKPCDSWPLVISPVNLQELWMGCGFPAGAGSGISAVYESSDGGKNWGERRYSTNGYFLDLTALSNSFVYMTYGMATSVTITYDGGKTWNDVPISCILGFPAADFIDKSYGWAACDSSINRTVNGGRSWECIDLPGSKECPP